MARTPSTVKPIHYGEDGDSPEILRLLDEAYDEMCDTYKDRSK